MKEAQWKILSGTGSDYPRKDLPHEIRLRGDNLKLLALVDDVAVGGGANSLTILLTAFNDVANLLGDVRHGHFDDEELELNFEPVVIVRKVDAVADGDYAHPGVPQVLQLHQTPAVSPRKAGEVCDHQNIVPVGWKTPAHGPIPLPFFVMSVCLQNSLTEQPVFQLLNRKRAEDKPYKVYMMASANKFLCIYYATVTAYLNSLNQT